MNEMKNAGFSERSNTVIIEPYSYCTVRWALFLLKGGPYFCHKVGLILAARWA